MAAGKSSASSTRLRRLDMSHRRPAYVLLGVDYFSAPHVTVSRRIFAVRVGLDWTVELDREAVRGPQRRAPRGTSVRPAAHSSASSIDWVPPESLYRAHHKLPPAVPSGVFATSLPRTSWRIFSVKQ